MGNWIFQGNPKYFPIDEYIKENNIINWSIRQKQYLSVTSYGSLIISHKAIIPPEFFSPPSDLQINTLSPG
ncbi:hypothetical protein M5V91_04855 [Cytobacillus pseudoceanisediminis]|nr:hypothetical protein [Cytobacillus pseudoceanisediminis]UQX55093.1 hypothetical protein M5V91_04855 [Cytobacillus pseudoceanisediminis]